MTSTGKVRANTLSFRFRLIRSYSRPEDSQTPSRDEKTNEQHCGEDTKSLEQATLWIESLIFRKQPSILGPIPTQVRKPSPFWQFIVHFIYHLENDESRGNRAQHAARKGNNSDYEMGWHVSHINISLKRRYYEPFVRLARLPGVDVSPTVLGYS